jgi:hypothetical protein
MVDDCGLLGVIIIENMNYVPTLPELLSVLSSMPLPYAKVPPRPSRLLDSGLPDSMA